MINDLNLMGYVPADIRPVKMADQRLCSSLLVGGSNCDATNDSNTKSRRPYLQPFSISVCSFTEQYEMNHEEDEYDEEMDLLVWRSCQSIQN
jgi:hypothetical protein